MRRVLIVLCVLLLLFTVTAGCREPQQSEQLTPTLAETATATPPPGPVGSPVAILVIDDFQPPSQLQENPSPENGVCPITPDGQGHYSGDGLGHYSGGGLGHYSGGGLGHYSGGGLSVGANVAHGDLVYGKLSKLIMGDFGAPMLRIGDASNISPELRAVALWQAEGHTLVLLGVDTEGFDTTTLADRIRNAMTAAEAEWGARRFVLNMSFGLIPCNEGEGMTVQDYIDLINEDPVELAPLLELLENLNEQVEAGVLDQDTADAVFLARARTFVFHQNGEDAVFEATTQGGSDELFLLTQDLTYRSDSSEQTTNASIQPVAMTGVTSAVQLTSPDVVIIIAAAGNSNHSFPFAPALWPGVVAVGAAPVYSSDAEVLMEDKVTLLDGQVVDGTSFAAPVLSFHAAVHLLIGGTADCAGKTGPSNPPLSYTDDVNGPWHNLDLSAARLAYCELFP